MMVSAKRSSQMLLAEVQAELASLGATLAPASPDAAARVERALGRPLPPGLAAFLRAHDGGEVGKEVRLLSVAEALRRRAETAAAPGSRSRPHWPVLDRGTRRFVLEPGPEGRGEWPVAEVTEAGFDRVGTSFLRFLHALTGELSSLEDTDPLARARRRTERDPGLSDHWLDLAELEEQVGRSDEALATLQKGIARATPPGPALAFALAVRALGRGNDAGAHLALDRALGLDALGTRDEEARLDAAALLYALAVEKGDAAVATRAKTVLGDDAAATAAFWRGESARTTATGDRGRAALALRVVAALEPEDADVPRLRAATPAVIAGLGRLGDARRELDAGRPAEAARLARTAVNDAAGGLGIAHALLAESLNASLDPEAAATAARKATELNPRLIDGWRELGDALLDRGQAAAAEAAFRRVVEIDAAYALGHAKLAQALLEQRRSIEALDGIAEAASRGGDPFFVAAIRGDIYAEMGRHQESAESYDEALRLDSEDHRALHQAAVEHGLAGNDARAAELFQAALRHDEEGCPQTLFDYANHLRKMGRIGDAVRFYRRAAAAVPEEPEWKQSLREAERELMSAPN